MKRIALDIETNGLLWDLDKIFVIAVQDIDTGEKRYFLEKDFDDAKKIIESAELVVAHNGIAFDLPVLRRLLNIHVDPLKVVDTIIVSRVLYADKRPNPGVRSPHSLENWGIDLGMNKIEYDNFEELTDEMIEYCQRDVEVTVKLFKFFDRRVDLNSQFLKSDFEFAYYMSLQEENGFTLDVDKVNKLCEKLDMERIALTHRLQKIVPPFKTKTPTYREAINTGRLLKETDTEFTYITAKTQKVVTKEFKFTPFNPNSRQQVIEYFKDKYNWNPTEFTDKGTPKVDATILQGLEYQEAQLLARIMRITKQLGMMRDGENSWLNYVQADGRVHGSVVVSGATGGRCTHNSPNLAQVDKKDLEMRACWIPRKGWKLVGADASGLELRVLAHYLARWDKGAYAQIVMHGDIHTHNMEAMGLKSRDAAKTAIYALIYGAGNLKLGSIVSDAFDLHEKNPRRLMAYGKQLRERIEDNITGYSELVETISILVQDRGFLKGLDGRPLTPRNDYSALNLLCQSAGATIMKQALNIWMQSTKYKIGEDFALCANVHDEWQVECRPDIAKDLGEEMVQAMRDTGKFFNLRCELDGEYQIGDSWKETH